jgi:hypothetical protein
MRTDRTLSQAHPSSPGVWKELSDVVARLRHDLFSSYRPELHYMRGPGPACRAKSAAIGSRDMAVDPGMFPDASFAMPGLRREAEHFQPFSSKRDAAFDSAPEFRWA